MLAHEVEGMHDLLEGAVTTAAVVDAGLIGLERNREHNVTQLGHLRTKLLVHKGGVGKDVEEALVVLLGQA